jgi:hypothetical protein
VPCAGPVLATTLTEERATKLLTFEDEHTGSMPAGWSGGPLGTIAVDVEKGNTDSARDFSVITENMAKREFKETTDWTASSSARLAARDPAASICVALALRRDTPLFQRA